MNKQNIYFIVFLTFSALFSTAQNDLNQFDDNGKRHGKWQKNFDGTKQLRYQGQFEHGKEVGLFKYYQRVGQVSKLAATKQFNASNNMAEVKFISLRGKTISEGTMDGKKYVGKWTYYHKNSENVMTIENYNAEGRLNGNRIVYYENGKVAEDLNYSDGKIEGVSKYYSEEGVLVKLYTYENDELHGETKHFEQDGTLAIKGQYQRGRKHGMWKYYVNGELVKEKDFTVRSKNPKKQ